MAQPPAPRSLIEVRLLDGPNLYFPRPAAKVTLDCSALLGLTVPAARALAGDLGLGGARPGPPGSVFRQRFAVRLVTQLVRQLARAGGVTRLAVRSRPGATVTELVVAYPWRNSRRAEALATGWRRRSTRWSAGPEAVTAAIDRRRAVLGATPAGEPPRLLRPQIPVVAVTGTNGKTTTSRMLGYIAQRAGRSVGWSSTDGVYLNGELVEAGDFSGPSGAGQVLRHPGVAAGGDRDRARRHPAARGRGGLQRRLGGHQHQRRPPRSRRHRHPRPAGRGQGGDHQDHQAQRLVRAQRRRPADLRHAAGHQGPDLGVHPRPGLPVRPGGAGRGRPGDHRAGRLGGACWRPAGTRCRWSRWSTCR